MLWLYKDSIQLLRGPLGTNFFWSLHSPPFSFLPYRTVKNEDDVLETDHQEQTYTITGAADDSDDD